MAYVSDCYNRMFLGMVYYIIDKSQQLEFFLLSELFSWYDVIEKIQDDNVGSVILEVGLLLMKVF